MLVWEPGPRERDDGGRALAASVALHAAVLGLAWLAPPRVPALALDPETMPLAAIVHVSLPDEAPPVAARPGLAGGSDGGMRGETSAGAASEAPHRARRGPVARASRREVDALGALAALAGALDQAPSEPSPYAAVAPWQTRGLDSGGNGLDMRGVGRGAGGDGGGTVPFDAMGFGAAGSGSTCFVETVVVHTREGVRHEERGCVGGQLGAGMGLASAVRGRERVPDSLRERHGSGPHSWCGPTTCEATVLGRLSRDAVRRVVRRHTSEIRGCYERVLAQRPDLEGRVTVDWTIGTEGRVVAAELDATATDLGSAEVETCIAQAVRRWTFPSTDGITAVRYPFLLTPAPTSN